MVAGDGKIISHPDPSDSDFRSSPSNPSRYGLPHVGVTAWQRAGEDGARVHPVHLETSVTGALVTACEVRPLMPLCWVTGTLSDTLQLCDGLYKASYAYYSARRMGVGKGNPVHSKVGSPNRRIKKTRTKHGLSQLQPLVCRSPSITTPSPHTLCSSTLELVGSRLGLFTCSCISRPTLPPRPILTLRTCLSNLCPPGGRTAPS